jgi:hypothetical protein
VLAETQYGLQAAEYCTIPNPNRHRVQPPICWSRFMSICHEVYLVIEAEVVETWTHLAILLDEVSIPSGLMNRIRCHVIEPPHTVGLQPFCWSWGDESETRRIFHAAIDRNLYTITTIEASVIGLICAFTPTSDGTCLDMHELRFSQPETLPEE